MSSVRNLGSYVREFRINAKLTQGELAKMVAISEETLSAIERNKRPITQSVLAALLTALKIEPTQARAFTNLYSNPQLPDYDEPIPHEMSALEAISTPAFYQDVRTWRVTAANAAARQAVPGLGPGNTIVEWLLLDPVSREVIVEWEQFAHNFVYSLKVMPTGFMAQDVYESIIRACSRAPGWHDMWNNQPENLGAMRFLTHIDPITRATRQYHITSFTLQFPRSGWWLWMVSPVVGEDDSSEPLGDG
ncbi:helix-turn-helix domain-containing protein [Nocardia sp. NPDC051570]|uniref:helix-turn-helix domain-containing protein n=1 Tax=Nocardia sp. NPDC051570 TaxID=3364324 RepID=UPI00379AFBF1